MPISRFHLLAKLLLRALLVLIAIGVVVAHAQFKDPGPDFDVRGERIHTAPAPQGPLSPGQSSALEQLRDEAPGDLNVLWSEFTDAPSRINRMGRPLTVPVNAPPRAVANMFLGRYRQLFNLSAQDVQEMRFVRDFRTRHNGVSHLTLRQSVDGIDVYRGEIKINIDANGHVLNVSGEPFPNLRTAVNASVPLLTFDIVVVAAADSAGVELPHDAKDLGLIYFPLSPGEVRLGWRVTFQDAESPNLFEAIVDAVDGTVLMRTSLTHYNHIPTHGAVYTSDSPIPQTPDGPGTPAVLPRQDVPFNGGEFFPHDDVHFDWWAGNARTTTTSNNVDAYADRDGDDSADPGSRPIAGAGEDFTQPIDLTMDPSTYTPAAVVNLFYWNNRIHDWLYGMGFDEASGNFQANNFGLGGAGGDPVLAEAQDNRTPADPNDASLCNANFSTPADGGSPRMQMFQCDNVNPERDGDLDNVVIGHEYGHGVHSRLVATSGNQRGNEGWSDYFGLALVAEPDDPYDGAYGVGDYLINGTGQGIRSNPYSTDLSVYTRSYADINDASTSCQVKTCSNDPTDTCSDDADCGAGNTCDTLGGCMFHEDCEPPSTAISQGPCRSQVHRTGELWANALWIMRMNLIGKWGYATGDTAVNRLVVDGMKMSASDPTFLDGRDAILAADQASNGGVNECLIWDAFARMGMGASALTTGVLDLNPIESFDMPVGCAPVLQVNTSDDLGAVCVADTATTELTLFNTGGGELIVTSVEVVSGSSDIQVEPLPETPVFIGPNTHVDLTVSCAPGSAGPKTATLRVVSNDPDSPLDIDYTCQGGVPEMSATLQADGNFGNVAVDTSKVLNLAVLNQSDVCPLEIFNLTRLVGSMEFTFAGLADGLSFPVTLPTGSDLDLPLRFAPTDFGPKIATFRLSTDDSSLDFVVTGDSPAPEITVSGNLQFGEVCAEDTAERTVNICNEAGVNNLSVTASLDGPIGCEDFMIQGNPFPAELSPDFCIPLTVAYTPTAVGDHNACDLLIVNNDDNENPVRLPLNGTTPAPVINVTGDKGFPQTVIQGVGACSSSHLFPVQNNGQCQLDVTDIAVTDNAAEYSLDGLPSFPIKLDGGELAGDGALSTVFAPQALARATTGEVSVTYLSDPIVGTETTITRELCGEAVHTGARVLVTQGGVPLAEVDMIQIQRINANRNRPRLDTVDNSKNLTLQTVADIGACEGFQYHREYGTVDNPIQLLPGSYQVAVQVRIDGRKQRKTVGFDVDTCAFNPTVTVDF